MFLGTNVDFSASLGFGIHTFLLGCMPAPNIADTAELRILFKSLVSASPTEGCNPLLFSTIFS
jgi:hypothetical protein